jgi:hypothetical protein
VKAAVIAKVASASAAAASQVRVLAAAKEDALAAVHASRQQLLAAEAVAAAADTALSTALADLQAGEVLSQSALLSLLRDCKKSASERLERGYAVSKEVAALRRQEIVNSF